MTPWKVAEPGRRRGARLDRRTCSTKCRQKLYRQRKAENQERVNAA